MTRVVFTVTNDLSYDQRMHRICSTLKRAGYDPLLVGFVKDRSIPLRDQVYRQKRLHLIFRTGKLFFIEYNLRLFFYLLFVRAEAICSIDLDTLAAGFAAARLRGRTLIFDAHEYYSELPEVVGRRFVGGFWNRLEAFLLPRVRHNYTVSESIARELEERYGQPYAVFPNYPELEQVPIQSGMQEELSPLSESDKFHAESSAPTHDQPSSSIDGKQKTILYQGALNKGRGIEAAIAAMEHIDGRLLIAGEGDLSVELRRLGSEFMSKNERLGEVSFLGYLQPEELKRETAQAWLGLNLLENIGKSYYYSLSNKFFDYVHAGLPQLTMDFPEYRRLNDKYEIAILLPDLKKETIVAAINELQDSGNYQRLKKNCEKARQELSWKMLEPELMSFYKTALASPKK